MQAVMSETPAAQILKTSRVLINWILPRWLPVKLRDSFLARKLGMN